MKNFLGAVLIIFSCMIAGSALCDEELPEEGMDPGYEPEEVQIKDESPAEDTVPVNAPEIEESNDLKEDEAEEESDYNAFEEKIDEIQKDKEAITKDE